MNLNIEKLIKLMGDHEYMEVLPTLFEIHTTFLPQVKENMRLLWFPMWYFDDLEPWRQCQQKYS